MDAWLPPAEVEEEEADIGMTVGESEGEIRACFTEIDFDEWVTGLRFDSGDIGVENTSLQNPSHR